jgi:hypothetical protein
VPSRPEARQIDGVVLGQLVDDERRRLAQNVAPGHPRIAVGSRPLSPERGHPEVRERPPLPTFSSILECEVRSGHATAGPIRTVRYRPIQHRFNGVRIVTASPPTDRCGRSGTLDKSSGRTRLIRQREVPWSAQSCRYALGRPPRVLEFSRAGSVFRRAGGPVSRVGSVGPDRGRLFRWFCRRGR